MTIQPAQPSQAAAGWYPDHAAQGVERWWDGYQWTEHIRAVQQQMPVVPVVVANQPRYMVTTSKRHTSHTFHLLMTIFTAGLWGIFVWGPMTILNAMHKEKSRTRIR